MRLAAAAREGVVLYDFDGVGAITPVGSFASYKSFQWSSLGRWLTLILEDEVCVVPGHEAESAGKRQLRLGAVVRSVIFSPKDAYFAVVTETNVVHLYELETLSKLLEVKVRKEETEVDDVCGFANNFVFVYLDESGVVNIVKLYADHETPVAITNEDDVEIVRLESDRRYHSIALGLLAQRFGPTSCSIGAFSRGNKMCSKLDAWQITHVAAPQAGQPPLDVKQLVIGLMLGNIIEVEMAWNRGSNYMLLKESGAVDETNKSYYGTSSLCIVSLDKKNPQNSKIKPVISSAEGPIQFWGWANALRDAFIVGYGQLPCKMEVWNAAKVEPTLSLGRERRNTLVFSGATCPQSRLALIGGFGNLPGDTEIWDLQSHSIVGMSKMDWAVELSFSPDSYWVMTATTSPRLRVGNKIAIYRTNGEPITELPVEDLYHVAWQPVAADPENKHIRALSPDRKPYKPKAQGLEGILKTKTGAAPKRSSLFGRTISDGQNSRVMAATKVSAAAAVLPPGLRREPVQSIPGLGPQRR